MPSLRAILTGRLSQRQLAAVSIAHARLTRLFGSPSGTATPCADVVVSRSKSFAWVRIPKVASTSIRRALANSPDTRDTVRMRATISTLRRRYPDYFMFAFVRNPWARVVSVYLNKIHFHDEFQVRSFFIRYDGLRYGMPFSEFVEWLCSPDGHDEVADRHWLSQSALLFADGQLGVDQVFRFEHLAADFAELSRILDIRAELPHHMDRHKISAYGQPRGTSGPQYYRDLYDDATRRLVASRYERDIEVFGYRF